MAGPGRSRGPNLHAEHSTLCTCVKRTSVAVPPTVRDRLRDYRTKGMSYADILTRLMDQVERERFIAEMRRLADEGEFVSLESV